MTQKPEKLVIEFNHDNGMIRKIGGLTLYFDFELELYSDAAGRLEIEVIPDDGEVAKPTG